MRRAELRKRRSGEYPSSELRSSTRVTVRGQKRLSTVPGYEQRQTAQTAEELRDTVIATENTALAPELEGLVERGLERGHVTLAEVNEALAEVGD